MNILPNGSSSDWGSSWKLNQSQACAKRESRADLHSWCIKIDDINIWTGNRESEDQKSDATLMSSVYINQVTWLYGMWQVMGCEGLLCPWLRYHSNLILSCLSFILRRKQLWFGLCPFYGDFVYLFHRSHFILWRWRPMRLSPGSLLKLWTDCRSMHSYHWLAYRQNICANFHQAKAFNS